MPSQGGESRLKDGQDAGKALLMIEARIGELLPSAEEAMKKGGDAGRSSRWKGQKQDTGLPIGITPKHAHRARAIASHPVEVAEAIKEAEENEDIPTKTAVLSVWPWVRLGELLKTIPKKYSIGLSDGTNGLPKGAAPRKEPSLPPGITKRQSHFEHRAAARRIGELCPAKPREETGRGKITVRDSDSFPDRQRLSEFRKLAGIPSFTNSLTLSQHLIMLYS